MWFWLRLSFSCLTNKGGRRAFAESMPSVPPQECSWGDPAPKHKGKGAGPIISKGLYKENPATYFIRRSGPDSTNFMITRRRADLL